MVIHGIPELWFVCRVADHNSQSLHSRLCRVNLPRCLRLVKLDRSKSSRMDRVSVPLQVKQSFMISIFEWTQPGKSGQKCWIKLCCAAIAQAAGNRKLPHGPKSTVLPQSPERRSSLHFYKSRGF